MDSMLLKGNRNEGDLIRFHGRIGENIKEAREALLCSQKEISELSGISQSQLSRIEAGERGASLYRLAKIAEALKVSPGDLIEQNPRSQFSSKKAISNATI